MEFKSKTALHEHIRDLVKSGYLIPEWQIKHEGKNITKATRMFKINFSQVTKGDMS